MRCYHGYSIVHIYDSLGNSQFQPMQVFGDVLLTRWKIKTKTYNFLIEKAVTRRGFTASVHVSVSPEFLRRYAKLTARVPAKLNSTSKPWQTWVFGLKCLVLELFYVLEQVTIGQRIRPSYWDTYQMNLLYKCGKITLMCFILHFSTTLNFDVLLLVKIDHVTR